MKFAIMMRAMDQDSGRRSYVEGLVETMLQIANHGNVSSKSHRVSTHP